MGVLFANKIKSIIDLHKGQEWVSNASLIKSLNDNPKDGFFYTTSSNQIKCISESAIKNALRNAAFWKLIDRNLHETRLSEYGLRLANRESNYRDELIPVLTDILDENSQEWSNNGEDISIEIIISKIKSLPPDTIPTNFQLWSHLSSEFNTDIFNYNRFRQLLQLMGNNGTNDFTETLTKIYLLSDDPRINTIREKEGERND